MHKDITLLQGEVTKVETTDSSVTYTSKGSQVEETLSYDYLVITSGSRYNLSFTVCFIIYIFFAIILSNIYCRILILYVQQREVIWLIQEINYKLVIQ